MISSLKNFILQFLNRKGIHVFTALIITKIVTFILAFYVIKSLSEEEYGQVTYAYNIISFITPFVGLGIFQSLSRYGPLTKSPTSRKFLFQFILKYGTVASIILCLIVIIISPILTSAIPKAQDYLINVSLLLITLFIYEITKMYFRIFEFNKIFARIEISYAVLLFILGLTLTSFYGGMGYLAAFTLTPLFISIGVIVYYKLLKKISRSKDFIVKKVELWRYGIITSIGGVTSQLLFSIDILSIGNLLNKADEVAIYKAASLIPFSLLFIPNGWIKTDLIKITKEYQNKAFLKGYIKNYILLMSSIAFVMAIILILLSPYIMALFGGEYSQASSTFIILVLGIVGAFVLRNLFGNLLAATGWAKSNTIISIVSILIDIVLNQLLIPTMGINGAAIATTVTIWFTGIISFITFTFYLKRLT